MDTFLDYEYNNGYREIHLGVSEFPDAVEPTRMGYSIGHMDVDELVVHSRYFTYNHWGTSTGE